MKVLLAEDSATQAHRLRLTLEERAHAVTHVVSLAEAIAHAAEHDVMLLDLNLTDSVGLGTLHRFVSAHPTIPVVVVTSLSDLEAGLSAIKSGAQDYLVKDDFSRELLDRVVRYAAERQRLTLELADRNEKLAELLRAKNELLGFAAHDLRNPLGIILLCVERLKRDLMGDHVTLTNRIADTANTMRSLVDGLLDRSAIQAGRLSLHFEPVDPAALVRKTAEDARPLLERKCQHLEVLCADGMPIVRMDPKRIDQVLANLIDNAAKFSPEGAMILLVAEVRGSGIELAVHDPGVGMDDEALTALFDDERMLRRRGTAGESSTGLGLAIVRKIVDAHGGRLTVDSTPGEGTSFRVVLPAMP